MYGIVCFFLDSESRAQKLVLGIPEVVQRHTGKNIAVHVLDIIASYEISSKVGYEGLTGSCKSRGSVSPQHTKIHKNQYRRSQQQNELN
jgi:hypothetical protein